MTEQIESLYKKNSEIVNQEGYKWGPTKYFYSARKLGEKLAVEFGERNNWKLSKTNFTIRALAEKKVSTYSMDYFYGSKYYDHGYYYRDKTKRAAALAVHLYHIPEGIDNWAEKNKLQVSYPKFPSWYYPGYTFLVLYEPIEVKK